MARDLAWIDQIVEDALEPELPICDPHHHFWKNRAGEHLRNPRYLLEELVADTSTGHNITSTVFIECRQEYREDGPVEMRPLGETEFVADLAEQSAAGATGNLKAAAGIIGHANLMLGGRARAVLEAQIEAGRGRFRGIRHTASWDASDAVRNGYLNPPPGLYLDRRFREGFAALAPLGLVFEAWCYHPQVPDVTSLARAFPDTTIVMDHLGGPLGLGPYREQSAEAFTQWKNVLSDLATCPNVVIKLGGIQMDVSGFGWEDRPLPPTSDELAAVTRPYHEHALEEFGVDRAMFESNFPVDKLSCGYGVLWNSFKRIASGASAGEKAKLFHDNAVRVYRL
jgi:predicted TIM-barrel fold metal-dependent hydrolase